MATHYPLPVFYFEVDWGGTRLGFTEVSGLSVETEVVEYRDGLSNESWVIKQPGMQKFGSVTFKRGIYSTDGNFFEWWNKYILNTHERRDITVKLLDENGSPAMSWIIKRAWPTKVDGPGLNATGNEVAVETLELVHEGLKVQLG